jgi:hypothetical protein
MPTVQPIAALALLASLANRSDELFVAGLWDM